LKRFLTPLFVLSLGIFVLSMTIFAKNRRGSPHWPGNLFHAKIEEAGPLAEAPAKRNRRHACGTA
jgi:hypothetical protein